MDNPQVRNSTHSTNDDAYGLALQGAEHGFGIVAATQEGGKGRLGKKWYSPPGTGLYCSIVLRPQLPFAEFPKLTLTAGLALCTTVKALLPDIPFGLKWPNDLYCHDKKCGGILVEASTPGTIATESFVVVGLGLNVNTVINDFPPELQGKVSSLWLESGETFNLLDIYHRFHTSLLEMLAIQENSGFSPILQQWRQRDILFGRKMQWLTRDKKIIRATSLGPDENGQLLARTEDGEIHEILSGDVELAE